MVHRSGCAREWYRARPGQLPGSCAARAAGNPYLLTQSVARSTMMMSDSREPSRRMPPVMTTREPTRLAACPLRASFDFSVFAPAAGGPTTVTSYVPPAVLDKISSCNPAVPQAPRAGPAGSSGCSSGCYPTSAETCRGQPTGSAGARTAGTAALQSSLAGEHLAWRRPPPPTLRCAGALPGRHRCRPPCAQPPPRPPPLLPPHPPRPPACMQAVGATAMHASHHTP